MAEVIAFLGAFPKLLELIDTAVTAWTKIRLMQMKREHREGIKKAVESGDQIDLEESIGSPTAGEPSNLPGTEHRDNLPGLPKP